VCGNAVEEDTYKNSLCSVSYFPILVAGKGGRFSDTSIYSALSGQAKVRFSG
jgi:hypothetical protein